MSVIRIKRGSGQPVSLQGSEPAFDKLNKVLYIGTEEGILPIGGEGVFAKKTFVTDAVAVETAARQAADSTLTSDLAAEVSRATAAEGVNAAAISAEETARIAAISSEASTRSAADTALDSKITTEKNRVDAILDASQADKDSFAEIVSLVNSIDVENDQAFAGYVLSNDAALAQEVSDRAAGDTTLQGNIDTVSSNLSALTTRVTAAEGDIVAEESARIAAVSAEASARASAVSALESADSTLQSNIDAEASTRATADTSLSNRLDVLEGASADSRLTAVEADIADHELRISSLETTIDGGVY